MTSSLWRNIWDEKGNAQPADSGQPPKICWPVVVCTSQLRNCWLTDLVWKPARLIVFLAKPSAGLCCIHSLKLSAFVLCTPHVFSSLVFLVRLFISWNLPLKQFCTFGIMYLPAWSALLCSTESFSRTYQVIVNTVVCIPLNECFICISCHTFE